MYCYRYYAFLAAARSRLLPHFLVDHGLPANTDTNIVAVDKDSFLTCSISNFSRMACPKQEDYLNCHITHETIMHFRLRRRPHKQSSAFNPRLRQILPGLLKTPPLLAALILTIQHGDPFETTSA